MKYPTCTIFLKSGGATVPPSPTPLMKYRPIYLHKIPSDLYVKHEQDNVADDLPEFASKEDIQNDIRLFSEGVSIAIFDVTPV